MAEKAMIKPLYKPVSMLVSVPGGILAGAIFKKAWKIIGREDDMPKATDARRGWREVMLAAALLRGVERLTSCMPSPCSRVSGERLDT
jgi:Protein of unknown function (DUF4235)